MKTRYLVVLFLLLLVSLAVKSGDFFLLPEIFAPHKGDDLNIHLLTGEAFEKSHELNYPSTQTEQFMIYEGNKKTDLKAMAKDSAAQIVNYKLNYSGLALIGMTRRYTDFETDKDAFIAEIDEEGQTKIFDKVNVSPLKLFKERYTSYLKTLIAVDKPEGNIFSKDLGQTLEIVLQQNPYKLNYGDDATALIKFKGKPLINAHVDVVVKTNAGKIVSQRLNSDYSGNVYFKLSREGVYMLRLITLQPSIIPNIDYEKWGATYTFAFSNADNIPNPFKLFGLGRKH